MLNSVLYGTFTICGRMYEFIAKEASGKTVSDKGKYLTVWKKQPDGSWKVLLDIYNSDLPTV